MPFGFYPIEGGADLLEEPLDLFRLIQALSLPGRMAFSVSTAVLDQQVAA